MLDRPHVYDQRSGEGGKVPNAITNFADVNSADSIEHADESNTDPKLEVSKSTHADALGMKRMGKQQQFVRHFRLVSTVSFVTLCTASWEIGLFILTPGLTNGRRAGLVWNVLWNIVGFGPIDLSMAEVSWSRGMRWKGLKTDVKVVDGQHGAHRRRTVSLGMHRCRLAIMFRADIQEVSEFAPEKWQRILSYISGFVCRRRIDAFGLALTDFRWTSTIA